MDIFFSDPSDIPLPPGEVRIRRLEANLWPDGRRVTVLMYVTPFQKRPSGEIIITNALGDELANISIIETMDPKMEFTLHLRGADIVGPCTVSAVVFYSEEENDPAATENIPTSKQNRIVVDQATTRFELGSAENP